MISQPDKLMGENSYLSKLFIRIFDISELNLDARNFIKRSYYAIFVFVFISMFSNTFIILFSLEKLTLAQLGLALAIQFIVQAISDYPTGAIGDWIGQKWVIFVASLSYGLSFFILSQVNTFMGITVAFSILGFARGQESGAFHSWFDNNYKLYVYEDKDRRIYGQLFGKFTMVQDIFIASSIILGGFMVSLSGRKVMFLFQAMLLAVFSIFFLTFIKDHPDLKRNKPKFYEYYNFLRQGISTVISDKTLRLMVMGLIISGAGFSLFAGLLLFPLYEEYGKNDVWIAVLRSTIFVLAAILTGYAAIISKKIHNLQKWLAMAILLTDFIFFFGIFLMISFYDVPTSLTLISISIIIFTFTIAYVPRYLADVLKPRFLLDIIPDKNRNAIYSLIPTLVLLVSVPYLIIGGILIESLGRETVMLILAVHGLVGSSISAIAVVKFKSKEEISQEIIKSDTYPSKLVDSNCFIPSTIPCCRSYEDKINQTINYTESK